MARLLSNYSDQDLVRVPSMAERGIDIVIFLDGSGGTFTKEGEDECLSARDASSDPDKLSEEWRHIYKEYIGKEW